MTEAQIIKEGLAYWLASGYADGTLTSIDLEKSIFAYFKAGEEATDACQITE